jgi:beta-lactamase superfamily II metal-dependent hydrolase
LEARADDPRPLGREARVYILWVDKGAHAGRSVAAVRLSVIAPLPGELFSETNDNSMAILLSYSTARILLAGDAEAREVEFMVSGSYASP